MNDIFRALADPTRRQLLDMLRSEDGQTLSALENKLAMTRFGVMKHLKVLEEAHLVTTRKTGREKFHYLNSVPIQQMSDRWISRYTAPFVQSLNDLKYQLEGHTAMTQVEKPDFILETFIRATPQQIWDALTTAEISRKYYIANAAFYGALAKGERYEYRRADGVVLLSGEILDAHPFSRLEMTFIPGWGDQSAAPSRNVYELEQSGAQTKLTLLHYAIPPAFNGVKQGWSQIIASLKSLLETGQALNFAEGVAA